VRARHLSLVVGVILQVTIVPRGGGALGFAQYLPKEVALRTEEQINDMICMALAGRAAEEVQFGKVTTGASNDLHKVTQLIYQMIQVYGFNKKIGQLAFPPENTGGFPADRKYSDATAQAMDEEAKRMVRFTPHRAAVHALKRCKGACRAPMATPRVLLPLASSSLSQCLVSPGGHRVRAHARAHGGQEG